MLNLAIFVSGRGSNFMAIHKAILSGCLDAEIRLLVSSKPDAGAIDYAREHDIPVYIEDNSLRQTMDYSLTLLNKLAEYKIDFIALCGYLKLIPGPVVSAFRNRFVNIHPALLPSFGGKGMYGKRVHEAVIESGAKYSGATVHIVDEEYDKGPIVMQKVVPVEDADTAETLAAKVLKIEHEIYPAALQLFSQNRLIVRNQRTFIIP